MKWTRIATLALAAAALGCSTAVVDTRSEPSADLAKYRTFSLDQVEVIEDAIAVEPFESAVAAAFEARGLSRVPKGGDIRVSANFSLEDAPKEQQGSYGAPLQTPPNGVVALVATDPKTNAQVWSGSARRQTTTSSTRDDRQKLAAQLAQKALEKFPRDAKK
jgi:hypothetical protein